MKARSKSKVKKRNGPPLEYTVYNIFCTAQCGNQLFLQDIFRKLGHGKYSPGNFSAIPVRFTNPKTTFTIFSSGHITSIGSVDVYSTLYLLDILRELLGIDLIYVRVCNLLGNFYIDKQIDRQKVFEENRDTCIFDEQLFPCLVVEQPNSNVTASVFHTGSITIYGATSNHEIEKCSEFVLNDILKVNKDE